jgi:circadian clock protein KaiC
LEERVSSGVEGLDSLIGGGYPRGSLVIIAGETGSGKTIISSQYLYNGASKHDEPGIYVSFAENRGTFLHNMKKFNMDFQTLEQKRKFEFLDYATITEEAVTETLTNVLNEIDKLKARRLVIDPFKALAQAFKGPLDARVAIHTILGKIVRQAGCTTLLISEIPTGAKQVGLGVEEFVADGVVMLDISSEGEHLNRRLRVVKLRGTGVHRQRIRYEIGERGVVVYQPPCVGFVRNAPASRLASGVQGLDAMLGGGLPKASITMVAGASGTGKTAIALNFILEGARRGERGLLVSFDEPETRLVQYAEGFGADTKGLIDKGLVEVKRLAMEPDRICEQLHGVWTHVHEYQPTRFVIENVTSLDKIMAEDEIADYLGTWSSSLAADGITVLLTAHCRSPTGLVGDKISRLVDNIIFLRDAEMEGSLKRSLAILKARGLAHDRNIREFAITPGGVMIAGEDVCDDQPLTATSARHLAQRKGQRKLGQY